LEITNKENDKVKVVFSGAGAAGVACAEQLIKLGFPRENIWMVDINGLIYPGRSADMPPQHKALANGDGPQDLAATLEDADIFIGLSAADIVSQAMLKHMAPDPIIFPMANPDPEIKYDLAVEARPDAIVGTGRSDYPNQINNVLGFPFIFRGALDTRARTINDEMMLAASLALAALAKEPVPDEVLKAYDLDHLEFGPDYVVPKPLDKRVCLWEAPAVAEAAIASGAAGRIVDLDTYKEELRKRLINRS
jgi:malate dehydrogenase (oxaloacetate-decarboxylating)(NADP+)